ANQQISKSANQQISKSANQQISKSANQQISKSANQQVSKSADAGNEVFGRGRRSVCVAFGLEGGVRLRVDVCRPDYVRAKSFKCLLRILKYWRFKTRFFASFLFAFEKK
ncbi:hypothetical protein, partial [Caballeronia sp.]|uniref:hypothetical protein n=1 Tax=Caballeronia sp. TaxID=1931223 RepID=UPI003C556217